MSGDQNEEARRYDVRLSEGVEAEIESAFDYLFARDPNLAIEWRRGLADAVAGLSEMPRRYPLSADSESAGIELRYLLYRFRGIIYRVTYTVKDADGEQAFVRILRLRHSARGG
jgi:plasmid stabilization system protein ParE